MHRTVYIKTTEACNLNCKHCFTGGNSPKREFLDVERTIGWVRRALDISELRDHWHFELHGGEPFLLPVKQLIELVKGIRTWGPVEQSIGATTNLVYKLTDDLLWFCVDELDSIATSWDAGIRFSNEKQYSLWRNNLKKLTQRKDVTLNVSLSKATVDMPAEELILFLKDTGCKRILFDRITLDGSAVQHQNLFPTNEEINDWYLRLHEATEKLGAREWFHNAALEDVYAKFENNNSCSGTFCRDCEERLFTINADGTIAGCPNSAPSEAFGHIDDEIADLLLAPGRITTIAEERVRNPACYSCDVFAVCGSDCYRLSWQGDVCAAPRQLMRKLSGLPYEQGESKRIIPIIAV